MMCCSRLWCGYGCLWFACDLIFCVGCLVWMLWKFRFAGLFRWCVMVVVVNVYFAGACWVYLICGGVAVGF